MMQDETEDSGQLITRSYPWRAMVLGVLVFCVALSFRLIYLHQVQDVGFFGYPISDARIYLDRAEGIADGDFLGPAEFVHAPLYAYCLWGMQDAIGDDPLTIRIVQSVFGSLACVLLYLLGRRVFDERIGVVASLMLATFPPAIFFDGIIQKTTLALVLAVVFLLLLRRCRDRHSWPTWLAVGVALGLLGLTRQNALAMGVLVIVVWWRQSRNATARERLCRLAAFVVGLAIVMTPWVIRNKIVTGEFVLTTPNLGQNFAMGNHPEATGTYLPAERGRGSAEYEQQEWVRSAEEALGAEVGSLSAREVSSFYFDRSIDYVLSHPMHVLQLTGKKLLMTWGAYEAPDAEDYYLYSERSSLLGWLDRFWHFGVLSPLAIIGVVMTWPRRRDLWELYGWLAITTATVVVFVVFARYRFLLVPALMIFASAGVAEVVGAIREKRFVRLSWALALGALFAIACNYPVHHKRETSPVSYTNHGASLAGLGRYEEDLAEIGKALRLEPENVDAHLAAGNTLVQLGRCEDAIRHYEKARSGDPDCAQVYRGLGYAYLCASDLEAASRQFDRALEIEPQNPKALAGLATAHARQGNTEKAISLFEAALVLDPQYADAHLNLGNTYLAAGNLESAIVEYGEVLRLAPQSIPARLNLAAANARLGQWEKAIEGYEQVVAQQPENTEALRALQAIYLHMKDAENAERNGPVFLEAVGE